MIKIDQEEQDSNELQSYRRLWSAVLVQHVMDAKSVSKKSIKKLDRIKATDWLFHSNLDFALVCEMAGYDAKQLRKTLYKAKENNFAWREGDFEKYMDYIEEYLENQTQLSLFEEV